MMKNTPALQRSTLSTGMPIFCAIMSADLKPIPLMSSASWYGLRRIWPIASAPYCR